MVQICEWMAVTLLQLIRSIHQLFTRNKTMKLAILGAGSVGSALGKSCAKQGHSIIFGVRDANAPKIQTLLAEIGTTAQAASLAEAADRSDVVVLTVTWEAMPEVVKAVGNLEGKILLDCTNPLVGNQLDAAMNLTQSGGEQVADWFPTAKVVKILNQVGWETMANPLYGSETATMFYAGNDRDAKQMAAQLAIDLGFEAIDAGTLAASKFLETLAIFWGQLAYGQSMGRNLAWRLLKR
jgi:8-hydroxy-5-deazaflavin:NADPH oxidoreductase